MVNRRAKEEANYQRGAYSEGRFKGVALWTCALLTLLASSLPLCAQQSRIYRDGNSWVEELTGTLPSARALRVNTDLGSVKIEGNAPRGISYVVRKRCYFAAEDVARRQFEQMRVKVGKMHDGIAMEGKLRKRNVQRFGVEFIVQVPRDITAVKVETRNGSLSFSSISATIVASTGAGLIKLDDLAGPVKITSGGGNVEAGNLGGDLTFTSGAADVRVANVGGQTQVSLAGGRVFIGSSRESTIQTGAGSIQVQKCVGDLRVISGGGNLYLGDVAGSVQAETQGGSVRLASASGPVRVTTGGGSVELYKLGKGAQVETGAGPISVEFLGNHGFTDSYLHTAAGDITVCLVDNLPVSVHATSDMATGPGIFTNMPGIHISKQGGIYSRSVSAEGLLNGGGPALRVRTTMGQIGFRKCQ